MKSVCLFMLILSCSLVISPVLSGQDQEIYSKVRVQVPGLEHLPTLQALDLDILEVRPQNLESRTGFEVDLVVRESDFPALDATRFDYTIEIPDMAAFYESRLDPNAKNNRAFPDGSMGGYYTNSEIIAMLDAWAIQYPHLITAKKSIGTTVQGRDIWAVKISDNPNVDEEEPECSFDSLIHANEVMGMMNLIYYMMNLLEGYGVDPEITYLVDNREIWCIPVHNPDGFLYNEQTNPNGGGMWRKNRSDNGGGVYGVDLNRNYGYKWGYDNIGSSPSASSPNYRGTGPFSEPETQTLRDFFLAHPIASCWNTHCHGSLYLAPFGYDYVLPPAPDWAKFEVFLEDISAENGYAAGPIPTTINYVANGGSVDWHYAVAGIFGIAPELGTNSDGFWPSTSRIIPLAEENQMPIRYWTWIAGSYGAVDSYTVTDDNRDGDFHPGEPMEIVLNVMNKGLGDTITNVTATLTTASPYITLLSSSHDFGTLASFATADNTAAPLRARFKSTTPYGTQVDLSVEVSFDGYSHSMPLSVVCGVSNVIISQDMESDPGWIVGDTGDDATYGIWERGDPIGTSSGGAQIQPEDDHTAAPGTQCFVTGNNSSTAGGDDVDDGKTTLKTAIFDLNGISGAEVSYWRWYADLGSSPNNDIFQVDVSDDGGATWDNVESLDHTVNAWTQYSFLLEDHVSPTSNVMMRFIAQDDPNDSLCEACIDDFEIATYASPLSLSFTGTPMAGSTVNFDINSPDDGGLTYLMLASLGTYPVPAIPNDGRKFPLKHDFVLSLSLNPVNILFYNFVGVLDGAGHSSAPQFVIPNIPEIVGLQFYFASVTFASFNPDVVKNISAPLPVLVQ